MITTAQFMVVSFIAIAAYMGAGLAFIHYGRTGAVEGLERYGYEFLSRMTAVFLMASILWGILPATSEEMVRPEPISVWGALFVLAASLYLVLPFMYGGVLATYDTAANEEGETA